MEVTLERLNDVLYYNKETGVLTWKFLKHHKHLIGKRAGCSDNGYLRIRIDRKYYMAHRIAWFMSHGRFPVGFIDHANGNGEDNRLANLRECSAQENSQNTKRNRKDQIPTGVSFDSFSSQWRAQIWCNGEYASKRFKKIEDAVAWRKKIKEKLHTFNPVDR